MAYIKFESSFYNTEQSKWLGCSPMVLETEVQSQVESYQRLNKWYLMTFWLTFGIIKYGSWASGATQGKESHPSLHLNVVAIEKGAFVSPSTMVSQLTYIY